MIKRIRQASSVELKNEHGSFETIFVSVFEEFNAADRSWLPIGQTMKTTKGEPVNATALEGQYRAFGAFGNRMLFGTAGAAAPTVF